MPRDANLYTLALQRRSSDAAILDLMPVQLHGEDAAQPHAVRSDPLYSFSRARMSRYNVQLIDAPTQLPLANLACSSSANKVKTMQLLNPDLDISLEKKGHTFRQEWRFSFADNDFAIQREGKALTVVASRKPDPDIDVARYTPPPSRNKAGMLQVLDYNIERLEVRDKKGLEVLSILGVCHCLDMEYDEKHTGSDNIFLAGAFPDDEVEREATSSSNAQSRTTSPTSRLEPNEIMVMLHTPTQVYVEQAFRMLRQDTGQSMHMIVLRANSSDTTLLAVRVAAEIKARWYKLPAVAKGRTLDPAEGSTSDVAEELYQYVRDLSPPKKEGQNSERKTTTTTNADPVDESVGPRGLIKLDRVNSPVRGSSRPTSSGGISKFHGIGVGSTLPTSPSPAHTPAKTSPRLHANFAAPPKQLAIFLSKDRIDEFEREVRTLADSLSAARIAQADSASIRTTPETALAPPQRPPKKKFAHKAKASGTEEQASKRPEPPSPSSSPHATAYKLLDRLRLR